jgi:hypothetical protein
MGSISQSVLIRAGKFLAATLSNTTAMAAAFVALNFADGCGQTQLYQLLSPPPKPKWKGTTFYCFRSNLIATFLDSTVTDTARMSGYMLVDGHDDANLSGTRNTTQKATIL